MQGPNRAGFGRAGFGELRHPTRQIWGQTPHEGIHGAEGIPAVPPPWVWCCQPQELPKCLGSLPGWVWQVHGGLERSGMVGQSLPQGWQCHCGTRAPKTVTPTEIWGSPSASFLFFPTFHFSQWICGGEEMLLSESQSCWEHSKDL